MPEIERKFLVDWDTANYVKSHQIHTYNIVQSYIFTGAHSEIRIRSKVDIHFPERIKYYQATKCPIIGAEDPELIDELDVPITENMYNQLFKDAYCSLEKVRYMVPADINLGVVGDMFECDIYEPLNLLTIDAEFTCESNKKKFKHPLWMQNPVDIKGHPEYFNTTLAVKIKNLGV